MDFEAGPSSQQSAEPYDLSTEVEAHAEEIAYYEDKEQLSRLPERSSLNMELTEFKGGGNFLQFLEENCAGLARTFKGKKELRMDAYTSIRMAIRNFQHEYHEIVDIDDMPPAEVAIKNGMVQLYFKDEAVPQKSTVCLRFLQVPIFPYTIHEYSPATTADNFGGPVFAYPNPEGEDFAQMDEEIGHLQSRVKVMDEEAAMQKDEETQQRELEQSRSVFESTFGEYESALEAVNQLQLSGIHVLEDGTEIEIERSAGQIDLIRFISPELGVLVIETNGIVLGGNGKTTCRIHIAEDFDTMMWSPFGEVFEGKDGHKYANLSDLPLNFRTGAGYGTPGFMPDDLFTIEDYSDRQDLYRKRSFRQEDQAGYEQLEPVFEEVTRKLTSLAMEAEIGDA
jgi:hypothetical protein